MGRHRGCDGLIVVLAYAPQAAAWQKVIWQADFRQAGVRPPGLNACLPSGFRALGWDSAAGPNIAFTIRSSSTTVKMDAITFERFTGPEGLQTIRGLWNSLLDAQPERRFFDRVEWYESYLDHLESEPRSMVFVVAFREGRPAAIFPLKSGRATVCGLSVGTWELPHHAHFPFADFIAEKTPATVRIVDLLIEYLYADSPRSWHVMRFRNVLDGSVAHYAMTKGLAAPAVLTKSGACDYLPCASGADLSQRTSKNFKGNLRKARNKLGQLADVEFVWARALPDLRARFDEFLAVEASGWKGREGTGSAITLDPRLCAFYRSLVERFGATGSCEINLLRGDGTCLAAQFCLLTPDARHVLKIGYHEQHARMAPGNILMEKLFERCAAEEGTTSVNLVTDADWHVNWNPEAYGTFDALVFNSSVLGHAAHWLLESKRLVSRLIAGSRASAGEHASGAAASVRSA